MGAYILGSRAYSDASRRVALACASLTHTALITVNHPAQIARNVACKLELELVHVSPATQGATEMSAGGATSLLFKPTVVGNVQLQHRVVLAPLTRNRANAEHVHGDLAVEYYMQRASVPGTLLITEAITIAPEAGGRPHVPGIWSEEQISAWKKVQFRHVSLFTAVVVTYS